MKTLMISLFILAASVANADLVEISSGPQEPAQLQGFIETLYGKPNSRACFSGTSAEVCTLVRSTVSTANKDLARAGATQRFNIVTCAQNPNRVMVIFAVKKEHKTVLVPRCDKQQIELIVAN